MTEDERREFVAANVMISQLTKRLILLESFYKQALDYEKAQAALFSDKAVEYWKISLRCRKKVAELSGEIWNSLS